MKLARRSHAVVATHSKGFTRHRKGSLITLGLAAVLSCPMCVAAPAGATTRHTSLELTWQGKVTQASGGKLTFFYSGRTQERCLLFLADPRHIARSLECSPHTKRVSIRVQRPTASENFYLFVLDAKEGHASVAVPIWPTSKVQVVTAPVQTTTSTIPISTPPPEVTTTTLPPPPTTTTTTPPPAVTTTTTTLPQPPATTTSTPTSSTEPSDVAPTITVQPSDATVFTTQVSTFSTAATGTPTPTVQWYRSQDQGGSWILIDGATSLTYRPCTSPSENGDQFRAVFTNSAGLATSRSATLTVLQASSNWAGYVDSGSYDQFTAASAQWSVPAITCTNTDGSVVSQWVGIDGMDSFGPGYVEQSGISMACPTGSTTPQYAAWYEMFGDSAVNNGYAVFLEPTLYPVLPGDTVSASVSVADSEWTLGVSDLTAGWSFSTSIASPSPAPAQGTAEFIVEQVSSASGSYYPIPDFGTATFENASVTSNGASGPISACTSFAFAITDAGTSLVQPGALSADGTSFTETWLSS